VRKKQGNAPESAIFGSLKFVQKSKRLSSIQKAKFQILKVNSLSTQTSNKTTHLNPDRKTAAIIQIASVLKLAGKPLCSLILPAYE
jgi:hypothetical protein